MFINFLTANCLATQLKALADVSPVTTKGSVLGNPCKKSDILSAILYRQK
jgi:hypothetical protein